MSRESHWTAEREERLRCLLAEGVGAANAAAALGVTRNALLGKADRMGLKWRPPPHPVLHPAWDPVARIWFLESGVEAPSIRALLRARPGATVRDYHVRE